MPCAARRQHLLLDAADRQHAARQRDLAGHREVAADRAAGQRRRQRRHHRHARRRAVLRDGAGRHVQVDLRSPCRTSDRRRSAARWRGTTTARFAPTPSSRRRAGRSASGCRRPASATPRRTAPRRRPASTPGRRRRPDPWCGPSSPRRGSVGAPSISTTTSGVIDDGGLVAFGAPARDLAADRADLALEIADAGLARVAADDRRIAASRERHAARRSGRGSRSACATRCSRAISSFSSSV